MMPYSIPRITTLNSDHSLLIGMTATCGELLQGHHLAVGNGGACGYQEHAGSIVLCIDGSVDLNDFVGLTVHGIGGTEILLSACELLQDPSYCGSSLTAYFCSGIEQGADIECVLSIECTNGEMIATCPNQECA